MSKALAQSYRVHARHIIERDAHVSWSVRRAAYYVITRLRDGRAQYWRASRDERRAIWLGARDGCRGNRHLYAFVTGSV